MAKKPIINYPDGLLHWCYLPTLVASSLALFFVFSFFLPSYLQSPIISFSSVPEKTTLSSTTTTSDPCHGRYIYVHRLPSRFNTDLLPNDCHKHRSSGHLPELCMFTDNYGMGQPVDGKAVPKKGWYVTDQFALDAIFYHRMTSYRCLTANSSMVAAVYVPFLAGLDIGRHLWRYTPLSAKSCLRSWWSCW